MTKTINRSSLAKMIYQEIGISVAQSYQIVDCFFENITQEILDKEQMKLTGFGSFYTKLKSLRIGRNPKTMEEKVIPAHKAISFYSSKSLRRKINHE